MVDLEPPFRLAESRDAPALAELVNFAGDGLPLYVWDGMKEPGETAWDVGRRRAEKDSGSFSRANTIVADIEGQCAACLIGYRQPDDPAPIDYGTMPPIFVPLQELENLAPASWYVNVLAAYPDYRGQGLGTQLLQIADRIARASGSNRLSLIASDANHRARQLYERNGYRDVEARPMIKDGWTGRGEHWILMVKDLPV